MKTRRLISNISFNTLDYFTMVVNDLFVDDLIDYAYWIFHDADTDDKKDHIHFCLQPSKAIDTVELNTLFLQFPFHGNRLPLRPTFKYVPVISLDDWLLYCKHDEEYLNMKGLKRNFYYTWEDFHSTDEDSLMHDINNIDKSKYNRLSLMRDGVRLKIPFAELIQSGQLPIAYRAQYEAQYRALMNLEVSRKHKQGFELITDEEQITF